MSSSHNGLIVDQEVTIFDRYRFAVPLKGRIVYLSKSNDGAEVRLLESNNSHYPVDCCVWVHASQLQARNKNKPVYGPPNDIGESMLFYPMTSFKLWVGEAYGIIYIAPLVEGATTVPGWDNIETLEEFHNQVFVDCINELFPANPRSVSITYENVVVARPITNYEKKIKTFVVDTVYARGPISQSQIIKELNTAGASLVTPKSRELVGTILESLENGGKISHKEDENGNYTWVKNNE